jgi:hypothetical protein
VRKIVNAGDLIESIRYVMNFLVLDKEPFHSIQFLLPCIPSTMMRISDLNSTNRDFIYDTFEMILRNWPTY